MRTRRVRLWERMVGALMTLRRAFSPYAHTSKSGSVRTVSFCIYRDGQFFLTANMERLNYFRYFSVIIFITKHTRIVFFFEIQLCIYRFYFIFFFACSCTICWPKSPKTALKLIHLMTTGDKSIQIKRKCMKLNLLYETHLLSCSNDLRTFLIVFLFIHQIGIFIWSQLF